MKRSGLIKLVIFISILTASFAAVKWTPLGQYVDKNALLAFFTGLRDTWWGPAAFILIYGVGCVVALPGSILTLVGGAIFGVFYGSIYNIIASNIGASLAFWMARFLGRDFVAGLMKGGKLARLDDSIQKNGLAAIFRLRLIPVVPFNGLNFGAGFSKVRYRDYVLGSVLGMLPGTVIYTYFADALLGGVKGANQKALLNLAVASVLLIALSFLPAIYKKFFAHPGAANEGL